MDRLDLIIERQFASANQQIPGELGSNVNGITNLDLTREEEIITSGYYDDGWNESSSSGFEDLPYEDDIILEALCEAETKKKQPGLLKRTTNNIKAKSFGNKNAAKQNQKYNRNKAKEHQNKKNNSKGVKKLYHTVAKTYRNNKADNYKVISDYGRAGAKMLRK